MFRKLQDRVVAAASNALGITATANNENDMSTIQRLQALGDYTVAEVESALNTAGGNVDRAAELLLLQQRTISSNHNNNDADMMDEDMELQRALQQSLEVQEQQQQIPPRSDIMNQAAEAAFRRAEMSKPSISSKKKKPRSGNSRQGPLPLRKVVHRSTRRTRSFRHSRSVQNHNYYVNFIQMSN
jgi:lipopolysaccharide biosynthesis regulator YciM